VRYIGLMSGTSMDAVDAALVEFRRGRVASLDYRQYAIRQDLRDRVRRLGKDSPLQDVAEMDARLGRLFARAVKSLLRSTRISPRLVRAIGSHGQTILHGPDAGHPYSLQIGDPNIIARVTGITTVADFRRMDLAAGGQGAPLAPAFHAAQFRTAKQHRCVLNIGGIANITVLPPIRAGTVRGFDTGPGNGLLDDWSRRHLRAEFDRDGRWAARGSANAALLRAMLRDGYFHRAPPKSTGREHFNLRWLERLLKRQGGGIPPADVQATLLELTASSIATAFRRHAGHTAEMLVCGGGIHNKLLMLRLRERLAGIVVRSTADYGLDPDCIEAVTFAWLAMRRVEKKPGNLPSVTGARQPVLLGAVYEPAISNKQ
jgi:anhydro-N-acetylmuramic acid kinase